MDSMEKILKEYEEQWCNACRSSDMVDIKRYIDMRLAEVSIAVERVERQLSREQDHTKGAMDARVAAFQRAIDTCEETVKWRLEVMNELHAQLKEQSSHFITRREFTSSEQMMSILLGAAFAFEVFFLFVVK